MYHLDFYLRLNLNLLLFVVVVYVGCIVIGFVGLVLLGEIGGFVFGIEFGLIEFVGYSCRLGIVVVVVWMVVVGMIVGFDSFG
jgi:hypothetical protein